MKPSREFMIMIGIALVIIAAGAGIWWYISRTARAQSSAWVYPQRTVPQFTPDRDGLTGWETVTFLSTDGLELTAWFIPAQSDVGKNGATVILVHGLGSNRSEMLPRANILVSSGYNALVLDVRDHGDSQGTMTTLGASEVQDIQGAVNYLKTRADVNLERLGILGHSMGGAIAIVAAARIPELRAIVAESAYSSVANIASRIITLLTGRAPFPTDGVVLYFMDQETGVKISEVSPINDLTHLGSRALLFVHGQQDDTIDVSNSQSMYDAASDPKDLYLIPNASHTDIVEADPAEYERRVVAFLDSYLAGV